LLVSLGVNNDKQIIRLRRLILKTYMDTNGVSNCQTNGEERFEYFTSGRGRKAKQKVQYDFRNYNGELFSCIANTLEEARHKRDETLLRGKK